jgi:phage terminase large subunit GpA-like protein
MAESDGLLFPDDRDKERRQAEWNRLSRIYGTEQFWQAYAIYIRSPSWRTRCVQVKKRARGRCERCGPHVIQVGGPYHVHHLTYDRFMNEPLSDLQYLCANCHRIADHERELRNQRAYEEAGEEAREAKGMDTYFSKKYGEDWGDQIDIATAYEEWWGWKREKSEEGY